MKQSPQYLYRVHACLRENESFPHKLHKSGHTAFKATTGPNHTTENSDTITINYFNTNSKVGARKCPHTTKQLSNTSWVFYNLSQFWHFLPGESFRYHSSSKTAHRIQMPTESPGCHLCFWLYWRFQQPPPWVWLICCRGSQNSEKHFSQWLTDLL